MRRLLLLCAAAALLTTGCATLRRLFSRAFRQPTLTFRNAELADASLAGATLNLTYQLHNPNPLGLSLAEVDYALSIEGHPVVSGKPPAGLSVRAKGDTDLTFPASFRFAELVPVVQAFLNQDYARYRVDGHLGIRTPLGILRFPVGREDQFEVPKVPAVRLEAPRITQLSLSGARIELPIFLQNRNSYRLPAGELLGGITIGGARVGNVSTGDLGLLEGRAQRELHVPLDISFAGAASAANALRRGSGEVGLDGQIRYGGNAFPVGIAQTLPFLR